MKISDLKDKQGNINIDLRIIWAKSEPQEMFGRNIKGIIVADVDTEKGPTAYLDIYNEDIDKFKEGDKIRVTDGYSKLIKNNKNQFRITNAKKIELIGKFKLEEK